MDQLRLYLLGSPHLERNGQVVDMDTRKALALLAVLAVSRQEQQRDSLALLLYPESDTTSARAALRRTLSTLHSGLGEGVLSIRREAIGLDAHSPLWTDVAHFRELAQHLDEVGSLLEAAALYRGDFMAGFSLRDSPAFDEWQYQQGDDLRRMIDRVFSHLSQNLAEQGNLFDAIQFAERRVGLDPLVEEAHRQLIELYARANQRGAALRQYRECEKILARELGVKPLQETIRLYEQISNGLPLEQSGFQKRTVVRITPSSQIVDTSSIPLVGREQEMTVLMQAVGKKPGGGLLIAVEGETGVGKTRFIEEFLAAVNADDRKIAKARCYDGQSGLAYTPFMEAFSHLLSDSSLKSRLSQLPTLTLVDAMRLFPGLPVPVVQNGPLFLNEGPGAQTRFFESLRLLMGMLLQGKQPGILFLDDLQWADSGTLDLLTYLARRLSSMGCYIVVAWRSEYGPALEPLYQLIGELQRDGCAIVAKIPRMSLNEIRLLAHSLDAHLSEKLVYRLYQESEGLPFIALEYMRSMPASTTDWKLPAGVIRLLHQRLQSPSETARQLLTAAAVIGRSFDYATLQAVSGRSEWETIAGLEELVQVGLIRELGLKEYDFSHDKLRAVTYEESSTARRTLLHHRTAEYLLASEQANRDAGAWAGLIANHFLQAGQSVKAADYFWQAGLYARRLHANADALAAFHAALEAGHPDVAGIQEACGDLLVLQGEYRAAVASYQLAVENCKINCLSAVLHKLGEIDHRLGDWQAAQGHYKAALAAAKEDSSSAWQAHLFADWSLTAFNASETETAQQLAWQALHFAETSADAGALAQAYNMLGILSRAKGEWNQAEEYLKRSLHAVAGLEDVSMRCAALHNMARLEQERGHFQQAISLAREALDICVKIGDRHHQAALLNTLADLQHAAGSEAESMTYLKQAVMLFAEIGEEMGRDTPEIWKLTEW